MKWPKIEIDHVRSYSSFDLSMDEEQKELSNWIDKQRLIREVHKHKGTKFPQP